LGISFGSINSGLPKDIVQQIVSAEKIPLQQMEAKKGKIENKKTLLADLSARMEAVRGSILENKSSRSFRELMVDVSNPNILEASVDKNIAEPGSYQIEVLQLAQKSSAISNGVEDKNKTYLGVGYIQYTLPNGDKKDVYVDEESSSLEGIAKLINQDTDNGMRATVVNDGKEKDKPWRLIISVEGTGNVRKADFPNLYFVDGEVDLYFDQNRDAQNAKIKLDGFEIEIPDNKTTDLIPGVTLDLKKASVGDELTIDIKEDVGKISEKVDVLIENLNNVIKFIKEQNAMDEKTDTSSTLGGDLTLQTIESRIRTAVFSNIKTEFGTARLGDVGVAFQRDGTLKLDQAKLEGALNENYQQVAQILTGRFEDGGKIKGFIDNIEDVVVSALVPPAGAIASRKQGLESQIRQIDRRIESKQRQVEKKEEMLKAKFARLEETISRIKTQGAGLSGMGGGFNPVQQLG
jgi:flagellar hook-associated protein 2